MNGHQKELTADRVFQPSVEISNSGMSNILTQWLPQVPATNGNGKERPVQEPTLSVNLVHGVVDILNQWNLPEGTTHHVEVTERPKKLTYTSSFSPEEIVEMQQGKYLLTLLKARPYVSADHGADELQDGRRFTSADTFTNWKRSDIEVKYFKEIIKIIEEDKLEQLLLSELLNRWVTPDNFLLLVDMLNITIEDVVALSPKDPTERYESGIDKESEWYQLLLEIFSKDDIVLVVMIRELILKSKVKPSVQALVDGLKRHFIRSHRRLWKSNDPLAEKEKRAKVFEVERNAAMSTLLTAVVHQPMQKKLAQLTKQYTSAAK